MAHSSGQVLFSVLLTMASASCVGKAEAAEGMTVRLFNVAAIEEDEIARATAEAAWVFSKAGIHVRWVRCDPRPVVPEADPCRDTADPRSVSLGVIRRAPAGVRDSALGFAMLLPTGVWRASVVYECVREFERVLSLPPGRGVILALAMAHEIGHVLNASTAHTRTGLMRARWDRHDIRAMEQRRLQFSSVEGEAMRNRLSATYDLRSSAASFR